MIGHFIEPLYALLCVSVFVAAFVAFVILVSEVTGFREFITVNSNKFFHKLFSCDFCLCFWVSVVISLCCYLIIPDPDWLIVPVLSTPISRALL